MEPNYPSSLSPDPESASSQKIGKKMEDISLDRQQWFNNIYEDNLPQLPPNPVYFWIKEDIFGPSLPGKIHLFLSTLRFKSRGGKEASLAVINIGEGIYIRGEGGKPDRVQIPFEIQVCIVFYSSRELRVKVANSKFATFDFDTCFRFSSTVESFTSTVWKLWEVQKSQRSPKMPSVSVICQLFQKLA